MCLWAFGDAFKKRIWGQPTSFCIKSVECRTNEYINNFKSLIKANTKAIVCMHASNVFGCVFPIKEIGKLAHDNGIIFIVDAAQSAGVFSASRNSGADRC